MSTEGAFVALCELANKERWCWSMFCTTCGHAHFRYALRELAQGQHPAEPTWLVTKAMLPDSMRGWPKQLGSLPKFSAWPMAEQEALVDRLAQADIAAIASRCPFPDWLGYLGLGLHYTEDAERERRQLTVAWVPQLVAQLPRESEVAKSLAHLLEPNGPPLTWQLLESVEHAIREQA